MYLNVLYFLIEKCVRRPNFSDVLYDAIDLCHMIRRCRPHRDECTLIVCVLVHNVSPRRITSNSKLNTP